MQTQGRSVSISIDGDTEAGLLYVKRAKELARRLIQRADLGGMRVVSDFVRLSDTAYCYAVVAGAVAKVVIVAEGAREETVVEEFVAPKSPDFLSGMVMGGTMPMTDEGRTMMEFWPTPECASRFGLSSNVHAQPRLAVAPHSEFSVLEAPDSYMGPPYSQYVKLKPTMYSGAMRKVAQVLMGFGHLSEISIYDKYAMDNPGATPSVPKGEGREPTEHERDVAQNGMQMRYDWRWHRTHGIAIASDGVPWLVEVGNTRGVIAMPLPLIPETTTVEFYELVEQMGDAAGMAALELLGGFPSGETFPADIEPWIRAGRVVRLVDDMSAFYRYGAFSSALGWAFPDSGREAHNTCVGRDGAGRQIALHFGVNIHVGAWDGNKPRNGNLREPPPHIGPAPAARARAIMRRVAAMKEDPRYAAVIWKIDHMSDAELGSAEMFNIGGPEGIFESLDAMTVQPVASCSGSLYEQERGYLYKRGRLAQYDIKFPSPELGYLLSWDMQPEPGVPEPPEPCNTTVHVFFVGEELKYVRFFNDVRQDAGHNNVTDDTDGCELIGRFTRTEERQGAYLPVMVYSGDFDDRDLLFGSRSIRISDCDRNGYSSVTIADDIIRPYLAHLSRQMRFHCCTETKSWQGEDLKSAMVVPFYDRCAYYYVLARGSEQYSRSYSCRYKYKTDPWSCNTWRNFPGYTGSWAGDINNGRWLRLDQHPSGCGPVVARTVLAPGAGYSGDGCSDFADQGAWCETCDNADAMMYSIPEPPLPASENETESRVYTATAFLVCASEHFPQISMEPEKKDHLTVFNPWFIMSPDPETNLTQYAAATHNAFGDRGAIQYYDKPNGGIHVKGVINVPKMDEKNLTFVGVV